MTPIKQDDPYDSLIEFIRRVARSPDRMKRLQAYRDSAIKALRTTDNLLGAWRTEEAILKPPAGKSTAVAEVSDTMHVVKMGGKETGLVEYLKKQPSVRLATMAALYFIREPLTPSELTEVLTAHGYRWGKGQPGDLVRSALWHARKSGALIGLPENKQGFATQDEADRFEREEVKPAVGTS